MDSRQKHCQLSQRISTIIDPPATMLNVTADNACAVMTARLVEGKNWIKNKFA